MRWVNEWSPEEQAWKLQELDSWIAAKQPSWDNVRHYLDSLGEDANLIATNLLCQGITGKQFSSASCPLAVALGRHFVNYDRPFTVGTRGHAVVAIWSWQGNLDIISITGPAADFMRYFDAGYYEFLVAK